MKKTLNIKITVLETGEELINEDTNAIICGIGDNDGEGAVMSNINGNLKAVLGALDAVEKAKEQTIKDNPKLEFVTMIKEMVESAFADEIEEAKKGESLDA